MIRAMDVGRQSFRHPQTSNPDSRWPRGEALVFARPGEIYRIEDILFGMVRDRCMELGCDEGSEVMCVDNDDVGVSVSLADGRRKFIGREYAWFVRVRSLGGHLSRGRRQDRAGTTLPRIT